VNFSSLRKKGEWLKHHAGEYVVVKGNSVLGFYPAFEPAYRAGVGNFGISTDFLVKQILEHEPVFFVL
jgi:epoxyqueuosine reductase QueG